MKLKFTKIKLKTFILLIFLYNLNIFEIDFTTIKTIKNNILEKYNLRFLFSNNNYDYSQRTDKDDIKSIENCEKTDYQYLVQYITGHEVSFDKDLNQKRAVSEIQYIII